MLDATNSEMMDVSPFASQQRLQPVVPVAASKRVAPAAKSASPSAIATTPNPTIAPVSTGTSPAVPKQNCGCGPGQKPCPNQRCANRPQAQAQKPEVTEIKTETASPTPSDSGASIEKSSSPESEGQKIVRSYWFWGVLAGMVLGYWYSQKSKAAMMPSLLLGAGIGGAAGYGLETFSKPKVVSSSGQSNVATTSESSMNPKEPESVTTNNPQQ